MPGPASSYQPGLVSIVMSACNAEATIVESIESVRAQTYPNWELIVIDDGSEDLTAQCVTELAAQDERIVLLRQTRDGVGCARANAMWRVQGEFTAFLDADDLFVADKIAQQVAALRKTTEAGGAIGWVDRFTHSPEMRFADNECIPAQLDHRDLLLRNWLSNGSNLLARTKALFAVVDWAHCTRLTQDWEIAVLLASQRPIVSIPKVLCLNRKSPDSQSSALVLHNYHHWLAMRRLLRQLKVANRRQVFRRARVQHCLYQASVAQTWRNPVTASCASALLIFVASLRCGRDRELRAQLWLNQSGTRTRLREALAPLIRNCRQRWRKAKPARIQFEEQGYLPGTRALADQSVLPQLKRDAESISAARLKQTGDETANETANRIPYDIPASIRQVAFDPALVSTVAEIYGEKTPWVMWGASVSTGVPNATQFWHSDIESMYWSTLTVVVGVDGCTPDDTTLIIPGSQHMRCAAPGPFAAHDTRDILRAANARNPRCALYESFGDFGNGRFYVFDAGAWHCSKPVVSSARTLLFLHYQRAREPRIPRHCDLKGRWLPQAAPYIACTDNPDLAASRHWSERDIETKLFPAPPPRLPK